MFGQSAAEEVDDRGHSRVGGRYFGAAVPIENRLAVGQTLKPELRDAALIQFPFGVLGGLGEDQGVEAVPGDRPADSSPGAARLAGLLRDVEVVAQIEVVDFQVHGFGSFSLSDAHAYIARAYSSSGRRIHPADSERIPRIFAAEMRQKALAVGGRFVGDGQPGEIVAERLN